MEKLKYAKQAVLDLINSPDASVDFHGLAYWAQEVERLREEIKKSL